MTFKRFLVGVAGIALGVVIGVIMIGGQCDAPCGQPVNIAFVMTTSDGAMTIPEDALVDKDEVYISRGGHVEKVEVEVSGPEQGRFEVIEGLEGYETLIISGQSELRKGDRVRSVVEI